MSVLDDYDPRNWFWIVGADTTRVYSSGAGGYVAIADTTYQSWLAAGRVPSLIVSEAELGVHLSLFGLRPTDASVLSAYQDALAGGIVTAAIFRVSFNHENRLRTIERALGLNGSPPNLTANQARAAVKALM